MRNGEEGAAAADAAGDGAAQGMRQAHMDAANGPADAGAPVFDMMWLDFGLGTGSRIEGFLDAWWPRLRPGGLLLMHSTLTNTVTRAWLESQRARLRPDAPAVPDGTQPEGTPPRSHLLEFETLSLLEPHKRYQNSVSIFQKRDGGWGEPVHTMYP